MVAPVAFTQISATRCETWQSLRRSPAPPAEAAYLCAASSMIGREDKNGPQGSGVKEDISFTLDAADRHAVAYAMTTGSFTQIEKDITPTLLSRDYKDAPVVTQPAYGIDRAAFNQGMNAQYKPGVEVEQQPTLTSRGPGAVAQPASFYPQMKAESQCFRSDGVAKNSQRYNPETHSRSGRYRLGGTKTYSDRVPLQGFPDGVRGLILRPSKKI